MRCLLGNYSQSFCQSLRTRLHAHATLSREFLKPSTSSNIASHRQVQMVTVACQVTVHDIILCACRGKHRGTRVLYGSARRNIKLQVELMVTHHLLHSSGDAGIHHKLVVVILRKTLMFRVFSIGPRLLETQSDGVHRQSFHIAYHQT